MSKPGRANGGRPAKKHRVLVLVHHDLVPKEGIPASEVKPEWQMEWDVVTTLKRHGHAIEIVGVHRDLSPIGRCIEDFKPTIAFNLIEAFANIGTFDQNVVSFLELLQVPYTGCNPRGLTLSRDKALAHKLLAYHRIPSPDFFVVPLGRKPVKPRRMSYPLIVKSLTYHSSTGISQASVVTSDDQLAKRVQFIHDTILTPAIIEQYIDGRELTCGVIGNHRLRVFPVWEMSFASMQEGSWRIATERVKRNPGYQERHGIETSAAQLPDGVAGRIQHLAKRSFRALELTGCARIDFRMDANGNVFVIEANPNPHLAKDEDFAQSAKSVKLSYPALLERILALGMQWQPHRMGITEI